MPVEQRSKKRKTIDDYLGINGLLIIAVVATPLGGLMNSIGVITGISATYYLIKRKLWKWYRTILFIIWIIELGIIIPRLKELGVWQ